MLCVNHKIDLWEGEKGKERERRKREVEREEKKFCVRIASLMLPYAGLKIRSRC